MENSQIQSSAINSVSPSNAVPNIQNPSMNKGSNTTLLIILVIIAVILLCCCATCVLWVAANGTYQSSWRTSTYGDVSDSNDKDTDNSKITPTRSRVTETVAPTNTKTEVYSNSKLGLKMNLPTSKKTVNTITKNDEYSVEITLESKAKLTIRRVVGGIGGTCSEDQKKNIPAMKEITLKNGKKAYRLISSSTGMYDYISTKNPCDFSTFPIKPVESYFDEYEPNYIVTADINNASESALEQLDTIVTSMELY